MSEMAYRNRDELARDNVALRARVAELDLEVTKADAALVMTQAALERIAQVQPKVLAYIRANGFKFETPLHESEGFEKLAFSIYTDLCEVDSIARVTLGGSGERYETQGRRT